MSNLILVIEDNPWNARLIEDILETLNYKVLEAYNGENGIEIARREQPGLILMDVMLPGINGIEVVKMLKSDPEVAHIPVIALTASSSQEVERRCMEAGCVAYMTKPFTKKVLTEMVKKHLPPA
jgi:CheY-like chemotaxis protein